MFLYVLENDYLKSIKCLKIGKTYSLKNRLTQHSLNHYANHKLLISIELHDKYYNFAESYLFDLITANNFKQHDNKEEFKITIDELEDIIILFKNTYKQKYNKIIEKTNENIENSIKKLRKASLNNDRFKLHELQNEMLLIDTKTGYFNISFALKLLQKNKQINKKFHDFKHPNNIKNKRIIDIITQDLGKNPIDDQHESLRNEFRGYYVHERLLTAVLSWANSEYLNIVYTIIRDYHEKQFKEKINDSLIKLLLTSLDDEQKQLILNIQNEINNTI